ncbi:MAG: glycoside hydrolase 43 family protein [Cypionkella sp.]
MTWTADNGDGTYTNPLFYEEFSDPDIIRVGDWFYLTGTTMHTMPGLPVLRSVDLVNWQLLTYAFDRLDLGPGFRLDDGEEIYGQGIWAPCLRYRDGRFFIFANINKHHTQIFEADDAAGPWTRREMRHSLHDLSVLFDDDGTAYVVWGYKNLQLARLTDDLTDLVPGTQAEIFPAGSGMGEGAHLYKVDGRYFITSAWFVGSMRMPCARADSIDGPWEINPSLSEWEDFGLHEGYRIEGGGLPFTARPPFELIPPNERHDGRVSLHQGGIVDTPGGQWWGWSMMDYNALGRLTCLSPVTWQDGWPYFGLPGNLGRTPRTWVKPDIAAPQQPRPWLERSDDFAGTVLKPIWQWNHLPDDSRWSLAARPGHLRLHTMQADDFFHARNTLTQRAVGPMSTVTVTLDGTGLQARDQAGLGLLGLPFRTLALQRAGSGWDVVLFDQQTSTPVSAAVAGPKVSLRVCCDFLKETAQFFFSSDEQAFQAIGTELPLVFQLKTFQGIRYALFALSQSGRDGGFADFSGFVVDEPHPRGLFRPIPIGRAISLHAADQRLCDVTVADRGLGRVALRDGPHWWSADRDGVIGRTDDAGAAAQFQWMETVTGNLLLLSLETNRYLQLRRDGQLDANAAGAHGPEGAPFPLDWREADGTGPAN